MKIYTRNVVVYSLPDMAEVLLACATAAVQENRSITPEEQKSIFPDEQVLEYKVRVTVEESRKTSDKLETLWQEYCDASKSTGELPGGVEEYDIGAIHDAAHALYEFAKHQKESIG